MMRTFAVLMATLVLLSGCSGPEPKPKAPMPPATTATPTATVPTLPPAARENTEAGAIAFVKHYIDVFNYASNTGDVAELQRLSDPQCEGCTSYIGTIESSHVDGGDIANFHWSISKLAIDNDQLIDLAITSQEYRVKEHQKGKWQRVLSANYDIQIELKRKSDRWETLDLFLPEKGAVE